MVLKTKRRFVNCLQRPSLAQAGFPAQGFPPEHKNPAKAPSYKYSTKPAYRQAYVVGRFWFPPKKSRDFSFSALCPARNAPFFFRPVFIFSGRCRRPARRFCPQIRFRLRKSFVFFYPRPPLLISRSNLQHLYRFGARGCPVSMRSERQSFQLAHNEQGFVQ